MQVLKRQRLKTMGGKLQGSLPAVSLAVLRHEDHFRGIIPDRRPVEIPIQRRNAEPASREEVFDLVAEEIPQRPSEHELLLTPARMPDGKNHLHVIPLLRAMERDYPLGDQIGRASCRERV